MLFRATSSIIPTQIQLFSVFQIENTYSKPVQTECFELSSRTPPNLDQKSHQTHRSLSPDLLEFFIFEFDSFERLPRCCSSSSRPPESPTRVAHPSRVTCEASVWNHSPCKGSEMGPSPLTHPPFILLASRTPSAKQSTGRWAASSPFHQILSNF